MHRSNSGSFWSTFARRYMRGSIRARPDRRYRPGDGASAPDTPSTVAMVESLEGRVQLSTFIVTAAPGSFGTECLLAAASPDSTLELAPNLTAPILVNQGYQLGDIEYFDGNGKVLNFQGGPGGLQITETTTVTGVVVENSQPSSFAAGAFSVVDGATGSLIADDMNDCLDAVDGTGQGTTVYVSGCQFANAPSGAAAGDGVLTLNGVTATVTNCDFTNNPIVAGPANNYRGTISAQECDLSMSYDTLTGNSTMAVR